MCKKFVNSNRDKRMCDTIKCSTCINTALFKVATKKKKKRPALSLFRFNKLMLTRKGNKMSSVSVY